MTIQRAFMAGILSIGTMFSPNISTAESGEKFDAEMCGGFLTRDQMIGNYILSSNVGTMSSQGYTMPMPAFTSSVTIFAIDGRLGMVSDDGHLNLDLGLPNVQDNLPMLDAMGQNWLKSKDRKLPSIEDVELALGCESGQKIPVFAGEGTVLSEDNKTGPAKMNLYVHGNGGDGIFASGLLIVRWPDIVMRL
ncbi:MAG TPA: hypothetical protein ENK34_12470, partial [Rhodobacteraceae bacterium]|nr:hypothetical protein [Paracoccaceae bacterium]